ncbi:hypothetical protein NL530_27655 [Klebsiella pneumoniae]|nr:hypothetical protein [Klebsiella pneumoniae]
MDYELTQLGRELLVPVRSLGTWACANIDRIDDARARYDARND